ncbi:hypothetical protein [uncultured Stenotrophomonas sp.]|uniref:hypothetical protein n=1 Tax=uncultured Stenotrophomonas sp. TaxID=165438 RepID=UPI0025D8F375|nr:hypothetical protein [uncultured Stenotrophomonas sp.]
MARPSDPCKSSCCKTPFGVCATKGTCDHHRSAQWDQELYDLTQSGAQDTRRYNHQAAQNRR